jgi:hypothetical protein
MTRRGKKKSLTPTELFDYRLASLLGYADIDQMKRSMTQRSYIGWRMYWDEEPWGPWRDNMHTAILARELRRSRVKPNTKVDMDQFMIRPPKSRKKDAEVKVFAGLASAARVVTAAEGARRMKDIRSRRGSRRQSGSDKK